MQFNKPFEKKKKKKQMKSHCIQWINIVSILFKQISFQTKDLSKVDKIFIK